MTADAAGAPSAPRVVLADDHTMFRDGLRRCLTAEGIDVVGEACDGLDAIEMVERLAPDVVLMDISMPAVDGIEATRVLRDRCPETRVVILTMHTDDDLKFRAVRAGAVGYLVKDCSPAELVGVVRRAASGEQTLPAYLTASLLDARVQTRGASDEGTLLSGREEEVLQLVAEGASTAEVAARLFISQKTVKNHLASIYEKLDSHDRTQAVLRAVRLGIIRIGGTV